MARTTYSISKLSCAQPSQLTVAPACRLILFLQQSSVEWCSSLWMHVVQEVDPNFQRTVSQHTHMHSMAA